MRKLRIGQRVWAEDLDGTFTVVRIDAIQSVADLELMTDTHKIEKHVPFDAIHPLGEGVIQAPRTVRETMLY
jgi:hypothetical protein